MAEQSSIFPIYLRAEYRNDGQGFARFQSDAQRAAQAAKREFEGVRTALDAALSRPRNTGGSLDLGVDEMRQAAMAQQQIAAAAREVAEATRRAATANGQFDAAMSRSTRAAFELAAAEERVSAEMLQQVSALEAVQRELNQTASVTDLVTQANRRGTTAQSNVINSTRASRTAFIQLGQQMQDVAVQAQMGTNAFIIFGQQAPQAAFALSGLADSTNKTAAAVGRFAAFMSGPFGALIFVGIAALGPLVQRLLETGNEADKAGRKATEFAGGLDIMAMSAEGATTAMDDLIGRLQSAIKFQGDFLRGQIAIAQQSAATLKAQIKADEAELAGIKRARENEFGAGFLPTGLLPNSPNNPLSQSSFRARELEASLAANRAKLPVALKAAGLAAIASANREIAESLDPIQKEINDVDDALARLNQRRLETATRNDPLDERNISDADFRRQLGDLAKRRMALEKQQRASGGATGSTRRSGAAARSAVREAEQLAKFSESAAEKIQRINERFDEQPRLVDAAAQATRQLDDIIADLEKRKPLGFEDLVKNAQAAKQTVEKALLRPIELIRQESEARLAIEEALAAGQTDRAAAMQEIFRLEQQIGTLTDEQRADIEDIVIAEQQRLRVLRDQQAVFNAQLDVLGTVRRDLTDLLSGRSADFFGNFRQALADLQGQRLFESIFGDAFRDIENELQKNTPQGRANKRLTDATDQASVELNRGADAVSTFTDVIVDATAKIQGRTLAANDNGSGSGISGQAAMVQTMLRQFGIDPVGMDVLGKRPEKSTMDIAKMIGAGISASIAAEFKDILGEDFATRFGNTAGGIIAGRVVGGTPGAVLGGLSGLTKGIEGLEGVSETLNSLLKGAQVGTQVAGISKALGLGGSQTGAQVGGVVGQGLGTIIGGPLGGKIGSFIGAIGGNFIGSLIKGTPRGSATIGGVGGSLGITGVVGNRAGLRDSASGLAGSVLEAVNDIARQLGAEVNASAGSVSIGQRKDSLRVDPRGGGATKIGNGAIDFGEDAEAAVAFAVRDLIQDGVITGLRQSEQNLLRAGNDIEAALDDVLRFRDVFDQLDAIRDPVGSAVRRLNTEFEGLIDLFERAGASTEEFADLEEFYDIRRAEAIQEATDRIVGSLRSLLNDLRVGDNGLSLRDRRSNALSDFNALAGRVAAGDASAFDDFAEVSQQLLDIERQLFGSTQAYFDRLNQVTALTEQAIADQTNVTSIGAAAGSPFGEQITIDRSIDTMNSNLGNKLDAINSNLVAIGSGRPSLGGGGGETERSPFPALIGNF